MKLAIQLRLFSDRRLPAQFSLERLDLSRRIVADIIVKV